ncbi:Crp/Fnr family transcriptional regulator [Quatrionicoccus australiensis]|uniref:Crp/Fnr family transcriptional regulator n=1 Tax=Quatrionicoccus australiensis TaxID=138118 RepID=UPI001CF882E7|nr:cyclic nucleotide-binding domain-containing protein [Quatrionicoccus australiensis]UCV14056.1 cyclic nucleotide-binding domain-containing protein [Quatrionicoccus australiensis]
MIPIEIFSHNTAKISIQAGQALFREGDEGNQMFILETGTAEVLIHNRVVEMLEHGSIVGEVGLVSPGPHSASVIAKTDCEFVAVDEKRFQFLVQQTPYFAIQVMRLMAERLRATNKLLVAAAT